MYENIYEWFSSFVKSHYSDDPFVMENILLKEHHSTRVSQLAKAIALSINLDDSEVKLAELIGLLHDTGRFPQFTQYRTFRDNLSVNHAELGITTLKRYSILDNLTIVERDLINTAILNHNALHIAAGISERKLILSQIIRDADKLDIIPIMLDYYKKRENELNSSLELFFEDTPGYNMEIAERILHSENVPNNLRTNYNDLKLTQLSWLLDLNFPYTNKYIVEQQFPERIQEFLPSDAKIKEIIVHIQNVCKLRSEGNS